MSWEMLLTILREPPLSRPRDEACPNDGTPYEAGPRGERRCPFDGFSPDG